MPAAIAACTVATHSSHVVSPHSMPSPPPPKVNLETGGGTPTLCFWINYTCLQGCVCRDARLRHEILSRSTLFEMAINHLEPIKPFAVSPCVNGAAEICGSWQWRRQLAARLRDRAGC